LPRSVLRFRGFRCFRVFNVPVRLEAYGLLPLPFVLAFSWTVGTFALSALEPFVQRTRLSSLALQRHLSVSLLRKPHQIRRSRVPRVSSSALQHFRNSRTLFFISSFEETLEKHTQFLKSFAYRVWLPSERFPSSNPRKPLSAPNALRLNSSEPFSSPGVERSFRAALSTLALRVKTLSSFLPVLQWLLPPRKAVPCILLPEGLVRVRASALLSFSTSRAFLPSSLRKRSSPPFSSPLALPFIAPYET